ncbi:hypothetical protein RJT34_26456 [Clitoria ternatea]|uniref:Uncharacterized protein n=1 Tax=Clitoria ternatea TaxID=43366 RepID=A0AAN9FBV4_CLITE
MHFSTSYKASMIPLACSLHGGSMRTVEIAANGKEIFHSYDIWILAEIILDISENLLSGQIPSWIGESLQQLKILSLRVNYFFGSVPINKCYLRQIHLLDLSRNNLSEGIPRCLTNFTAMMESSIIAHNIIRSRKVSSRGITFDIYNSNVLLMRKGLEHVFLNPEFLLKSIDLSGNNLTGEIPKEVGYLLGLVSLNLSRNNLRGNIPPEIGNLSSLEFLDLSKNHLSGKIPSTLSMIDHLSVLDLSDNFLSGRIPLGRQLQTFDAASFEGNLDLCGNPLNITCPEDQTPVKPLGPTVHGEDDSSFFQKGLYMSLGYFLGLSRNIDLSRNNLTGEIPKPKEIGYFLGLVSLNLSRISLSGEIHSEIGNLNSLEFVDLSRNHLSGKISPTLPNIDCLAALFVIRLNIKNAYTSCLPQPLYYNHYDKSEQYTQLKQHFRIEIPDLYMP